MNVDEIGALVGLIFLLVVPVTGVSIWLGCELVLYMRREWRKR